MRVAFVELLKHEALPDFVMGTAHFCESADIHGRRKNARRVLTVHS